MGCPIGECSPVLVSSAPRLLVVGGGISGLAAAWEGVRRGAHVTIVESATRWGGKIHTEHADGFLIEHGPDGYLARKPAIGQLIGELGLDDRVIGVDGEGAARQVQVRSDGVLRPLPSDMGAILPTKLRPFVTTPILRPRDKARAALDLVRPRVLGGEDTSVGAFLRTRLGDGVTDRLADPLVSGIYGLGIDELSLDATMPMLRDSEERHRSLVLAGLAQGRAMRRGNGVRRGVGSPFQTMDAGLGGLVEALVTQLEAAGAELRLGQSVTRLSTSAVAAVVAEVGGVVAEYDAVVLTVGAQVAADLLEPTAPGAAEPLRQIGMVSTNVVHLGVPEDALGDLPSGHGWLEAGRAPVSAVTIASRKWQGRAPEGMVLLRVSVPSRVGPIAEAPEGELLAAVHGYLRTTLGFTGDPALTRVARWRGVMPAYRVGHAERVRAAAAGLTQQSTWRLAGALTGVGIPDCIDAGRQAALRALS